MGQSPAGPLPVKFQFDSPFLRIHIEKNLEQKERLRIAENENRQLRAKLAKATADLEYVAMMADVDMDEAETENE